MTFLEIQSELEHGNKLRRLEGLKQHGASPFNPDQLNYLQDQGIKVSDIVSAFNIELDKRIIEKVEQVKKEAKK